jgi:hypothetical protein
VTLRVVVLCLALAAFFGYVIPVVDYKLFNTFLDGTHLPPGAVGALLVLLLVVNPLLRLISKKFAFSRNETLTVYITCLFSSLVPGHGGENFIIPNLLAPFYFATPENRWLNVLQPYLKPWLTPALNADGTYNRAVVEGWYIGAPHAPIPWAAWLVPLAFWGGFVLISYIMLGCLSVMLRAQWAEKEALAFPLLRQPLELTAEDPGNKSAIGPFFRNPLMWVGFAIAVLIQLIRGLHVYFPDVPTVPLDLDTGALFTETPWNQIGWMPIYIYPIVIGITYLLTSEVSFSLWFFPWFIAVQYIVAYSLGFAPNSLPDAAGAYSYGKLFTGFQMGGSYIAYVAIVLWAAREHLLHVARRAFGRARSTPAEAREILSYPAAFWGFIVSFALILGLSCVAGMRLDVALALWIGYLVFAIALTRVAVEGGMLFLLHDSAPLGAVARLLGSGPSTWLTPASGLVPASFFQAGMVVHMRGFIMPSFMHSFKLAHDRKIAAKPLGVLIAAVVLIAMSVSWWTVVRLGYQNGGLQLGHKWYTTQGSLWPVNFITSISSASGEAAWLNWIWMSVGALLTFGMMAARSRLLWFPLHPIGYLMCLTFPIKMFWFSIFLGWLCKVLITRFGGNETYRKTTPAFLGLALGDVTMMLFWLLIDGLQGRVGHQLMPG